MSLHELFSDAEVERRLSAAQGEGCAPNFARWRRFAGMLDHWVELQALAVRERFGTRTLCAHAREPGAIEALLAAGDELPGSGVYVVANRVNDAVTTRVEPGRWHRLERGASTSDRDIVARHVLFVDVDAVRPTGTSASDAEVALTVPVATAVARRLAAYLDEPGAIGIGHSGNGRQVFVALEPVASTTEATDTIRRVLVALAKLHAAPGVAIDDGCHDARRLVPAFGTVKRKGTPHAADRPHRRTAFVCADEVVRAPWPALESLRDALEVEVEQREAGSALPARPARPSARRGAAASDDSPFLRANALAVEEVAAWLGLVEDGRVRCPGCRNTDGVAVLDHGLKCHHRSCVGKGKPGRPGFRTVVDLVAETKSVEPREALEFLAERFPGIDLPPRRAARAFTSPESVIAAWRAPELAQSFEFNDTGNAERLVALHGLDVRHCGQWKKWLVWDGRRWALDDLNRLQLLAKSVGVQLAMEAERPGVDPDQASQILKFALRSGSRGARDAMIALAGAEERVAISYEHLDAEPFRLTCANGTLDLRAGELGGSSREHLLTKMTQVAYDPVAECPRWLAFLATIMGGDQELVRFLQRAVGYSLTGDVSEQVLFFLHGSGSNGKSTFTRVMQDVLGEYATQAPPDLLIAKKNATHPTELTSLFGCRLAVCQEVEAGSSFAEVTVKQLTGGDRIAARRMREDYWYFQPTHKLWIAGNHKPNVRGVDHAMWRRIRLVPFAVTIADSEKDPHLPEKLAQELPGILRWAVEGCREWQRIGLAAPAVVLAATEEYREEQDVVGDFLAERCAVDQAYTCASSALYEAYTEWCEESGQRPMSQRAIAERLRQKGCAAFRGTAGRRMWRGVRPRDAQELAVARYREAQADGDEERRAIAEYERAAERGE